MQARFILNSFAPARRSYSVIKRSESMGLKWTDTLDIAIELDERHPDIDPLQVNFVDLRNWVLALEEFDDDPEHSGERILEAIQMAWIEERE